MRLTQINASRGISWMVTDEKEQAMSKPANPSARREERPTEDDLRRILGDLGDAKTNAILALNPTFAQLEEAAVWLAGAGDPLAEAGRPLIGVAADIRDIIAAEEEAEEPGRRWSRPRCPARVMRYFRMGRTSVCAAWGRRSTRHSSRLRWR
jgi:hypothetical protein